MARTKRKPKPIGPVAGIITLALIAAIGSCVMVRKSQLESEQLACRSKARAYYQSIGSYPRFTTGESTEDEIDIRCRNSPGAFDGLTGS